MGSNPVRGTTINRVPLLDCYSMRRADDQEAIFTRRRLRELQSRRVHVMATLAGLHLKAEEITRDIGHLKAWLEAYQKDSRV